MGISAVSLFLDANNNGVLDAGDNLLAAGTYPADNGALTLNFTNVIPAFGAENILVVYNFSGSAGAGTYQANLSGNNDVTGMNEATGLPVVVSGAPLAGSVVTLAAATATPSFTPTSTITFSATPIPTPAATINIISAPYPNPATGPVTFDIQTAGLSDVKWSVFTTAFRKIVDGNVSINGMGEVRWDLTDKKLAEVGNGIYYVRIEVFGSVHYSKIWKVIVVR